MAGIKQGTTKANKRHGNKKGKAPHAVNTVKGFDKGFTYAAEAKTNPMPGQSQKTSKSQAKN